MTPEQIKNLEKSVENLKNKSSRVYFMVQDTKGNARASIAHSYRMAMTLKKNGFPKLLEK